MRWNDREICISAENNKFRSVSGKPPLRARKAAENYAWYPAYVGVPIPLEWFVVNGGGEMKIVLFVEVDRKQTLSEKTLSEKVGETVNGIGLKY